MLSLSRVTRVGLIGGSLLAAACSRPDFNTDLNEGGPPQVTLVAVASEGAGDELATFCGSVKRNEMYCDADIEVAADKVIDAIPMGFSVRIAFDELLDPSIEKLYDEDGNEVVNDTQVAVSGSVVDANPVTIECDGVELAYIGHYEPSGNIFTYPAGPALVVTVTDTVGTGEDCTATINAIVTDKSGEPVPADETGPYTFTIAPLAVGTTSPKNEATGVVPTADTEVFVDFNNLMDEASLAGEITLTDAASNVIAATITLDGSEVTLVPDAGWLENTVYTVSIGAAVADVKGGTLGAAETFSFTTGPVPSE